MLTLCHMGGRRARRGREGRKEGGRRRRERGLWREGWDVGEGGKGGGRERRRGGEGEGKEEMREEEEV